ncbi:hypothetical protein K443DRAFT_685931 [Laccaria amethystina LaAM-08-1]|uniref:Uncharacterized protein n=1 Tax=Laccaria amethystina LaAM-08-1 TaxID=1095629 RepID=A0A0C9X4Y2_9AGAR|nr:hypothetical protein K443DRAFT_685931 [Laccaria amethystina LaAM-08-1]
MSNGCWNLVKERKFITVEQQNRRFSVEDITTRIDLFISHNVRCITLHYSMADLRKAGSVGTDLQIKLLLR